MQAVRYITVAAAIAMVAGCSSVKPATNLGKGPGDGAPVKIASLTTSKQPETIEGTMIDKCPVAGCWFHVKDSSGVVKVDLKSAGFVVLNVPVNSHVVVTGKFKRSDEDTLVASGMSYR